MTDATRAGWPETLALGLAVALPVALGGTHVHLVPAGEGAWWGLAHPPTLLRGLLAALVGAGGAALALRWPARVRRPLLVLIVAATPLVPGLTGAAPGLLLFQGPTLVLVAAVALGLSATAAVERARAIPDVPAGVLFGAALLAYALFGMRVPGPAGPQGDEPHYLLMTVSLLKDGDLDLADEFRRHAYAPFYAGTLGAHTSPASPPGTLYPVHAPGLAALILPAYALGGYPAARLFLSSLAALTGVLVSRLVRDVTGSGGLALAAWAALVLTPPFAVYAVSIYPEAPAALATAVFLLSARQGTDRGPAFAGAVLAAAALPWLHPKFLPLAALGLLLALLRPRPAWQRALGLSALLASLGALLAFFHAVYGRASLSAAYGPGFASDVSLGRLPWGLAALVFDRQFGLLGIAPLWLLAFPGAVALWRRRRGDALRALLLASAVLVVGGSFSMWWGGACPPGRFVVPALPALALALAFAFEERPEVSAVLVALGAGVLGVAAGAPRALHNRPDGESGLLKLLAPSLDLSTAWPSFVLGGEGAALLALTLGAALALAWRGRRTGLVFGATAYGALALALGGHSFLNERSATEALLEDWDPGRLWGPRPLELARLGLPLELPEAPWVPGEGRTFTSRRIDLPAGLYQVEVRGRVLRGEPQSHVTRLDLTADSLALERAFLQEGSPPPSFPLLLPAGVRRMTLTATGSSGLGQVDAVRLVPEALVPASRRDAFHWLRAPEAPRYRAGDDVRVTALDRSHREGEGFRLAGDAGEFLVEVPPGLSVVALVRRPRPGPGDELLWDGTPLALPAGEEVSVRLPSGRGLVLGATAVVPAALQAYGAWIGWSASPGETSATSSKDASPPFLPTVTTTSAPPDSAKE